MTTAFGVDFSRSSLDELVETIVSNPIPTGTGIRLIATANVDHIVNLRKNAAFRAAYRRTWLVTADGFPVYLYAATRGLKLPGRVSGADIFPALMHRLEPERHRPFFVVSTTEAASRLRDWLTARGFAPEAIQTVCPPFGFEHDEKFSEDLAARIHLHRTTHLVFGVGSPKSEVWIDRYRCDLGDCYALGVGAGVDYFAGTAQRAPRLMRRVGLEWLWRFLLEPKRMFRRYFVDSWTLFAAIKDDLTRSNELDPIIEAMASIGESAASLKAKRTKTREMAVAGNSKRKKRVIAVASAGGHWVQLMRLEPALRECRVRYVTTLRGFSCPNGTKPIVIRDASRTSPLAMVVAALQVFNIIVSFRPNVVITTGAAPGLLAIQIGKLLGARTIWLDSIANVNELSLSGLLAKKSADLWLTQWQQLPSKYKGLKYRGKVI